MMNILLDTHTCLWALEDNPRLPALAREMITNLDNNIFVSVVSIWEVSLKKSKDKDFADPADVVKCSQKAGFRFLALGVESILRSNNLKVKMGEYVNKDPFDRILVSQAVENEMVFLTSDDVIKHYDEDAVLYIKSSKV